MKFFGKNPNKRKQREYAKLSNYKNGRFQNPNQVVFKPGDIPFFRVLWEVLHNKVETLPKKVIPSVKTDLKNLPTGKPVVVWFGHSSYLISYNGFNILIDPVFSGHASPFWFIRAFKGSDIYKAKDMPEIDVLVITHDHYDHLDYETVRKLKPKVKQIVTALGVGSHLEYWGYDKNIIHELNWFDSTNINETVKFTATPAQHMSSRGLRFQKTLWVSFVLQLDSYKIFIGGDSGYGKHFQEIGEKFGPFDLAFLENGQYNKHWRVIHGFPQEAVQVARDMKVKMIFPVHWAKFRLAYHEWNNPIKEILQFAGQQQQLVTVPKIGEPYILDDSPLRDAWWDF